MKRQGCEGASRCCLSLRFRNARACFFCLLFRLFCCYRLSFVVALVGKGAVEMASGALACGDDDAIDSPLPSSSSSVSLRGSRPIYSHLLTALYRDETQ